LGLDEALRGRIAEQYRRATSAGRWSGLYAATNPNEYWAELSMWYFGALAAYDPDGQALLDNIYSGRLTPSAVKISPVHVVTGSAQLHSLGGGGGASLVLRNDTSKTFSLQRLDFRGQPGAYCTLEGLSH